MTEYRNEYSNSKDTNFYFLGDSVLRDAMITLLNYYESDNSHLLTRNDGKRNCEKYLARDFGCFMDSANFSAQFFWFQWYSLPHRLHGTTFQSAQEVDICSSYHASNKSMAQCLTHILVNVTAADTIVFRVGLNYLLFEPIMDSWSDKFTEDLKSFLRVLHSLTNGRVVFLLLGPVMEYGQSKSVCLGDGFWDRTFFLMNPKIRRLNNITRQLVTSSGYFVIDPWNYTTPSVMVTEYLDCVHPAVSKSIHITTVSHILNVSLVQVERTSGF